MKLTPFTKSKNKPLQRSSKSYIANSVGQLFNPIEFANFLITRGDANLGFNLLNTFYRLCPPVSDSIDRIAKEFASIQPQIYDTQEEQFVDSRVLEIFKNPTPWMSQTQFLHNVAATYLISGNIFLYTVGVASPREINYIEPQYLSFKESNFNTLTAITSDKNRLSETYSLEKLGNQNFFVSSNGTERGLLLQTFNPNGTQKDLYFGASKLVSISQEIMQYVFSSTHNINLLSNGAKLSGILKTGDLTDDQIQRLEVGLEKYRGSDNAGKVLVLENGLGFDSSVMTNVDMDYKTMRQEVKKTIYERFEIPTALITESAMTYNNLEVARLMLYENAVLPLAKTIYKHLQDLIFPYFSNLDPMRYEIRYDENDIGAVRFRNSQIMVQMDEANAFTMNEKRSVGGWEQLASGGDTVYGNNTSIPLAEAYEEDPEVLDGTANT